MFIDLIAQEPYILLGPLETKAWNRTRVEVTSAGPGPDGELGRCSHGLRRRDRLLGTVSIEMARHCECGKFEWLSVNLKGDERSVREPKWSQAPGELQARAAGVKLELHL